MTQNNISPTQFRKPRKSSNGIFGRPVCGTVFWMARNEVSVEEAIHVCQFLGSSVKEETIRGWHRMASKNHPKSIHMLPLTEQHIDAIEAALPKKCA